MAFGACSFNPGPAGSATGAGASIGSGTGASSGTGRGGTTGIGSGSGGSEFGGNDASCGQVNAPTMNLPGDLLYIEDKSGSMNNNFMDQPAMNGQTTKWDAVTAALNTVVMSTQAQINWGLKFFANNNQCTVNAGATVAPGPNNAAAIMAAIARTAPGGFTPTRAAVQSGVAYLQTLADQNPKYILLATDGQPNCMGNTANTNPDDAAAITAVGAAFQAGFPVFVVGVGNVAMSEQTLNSMATAGGRPQATPNVDTATGVARVYYPADDPTQLQQALETIAGQVKSCVFQLGGTPPDPTNIAVLADGKQVPKDPVNGWSYTAGMMAVQLNGTACTNVMNGTTQTISAIFGCPGITIVIP